MSRKITSSQKANAVFPIRDWQAQRVVGQVPGNSGQELVIGGYIPGAHGVDAIVVGYYRGEDLIYVARVRNGFVPASRRQMFARLKPLLIS